MAHHCPECGLLCHCGGDLTIELFDDTPAQDRCICCEDDDDADFYDEDDEDEDWTDGEDDEQ